MTSKHEKNLRELALELYHRDAIKFGDYRTKSGLSTPVYCDLRVLVSHPEVMSLLADVISDELWKCGKQHMICGVPYTALPIATLVSHKTKTPMVMRRKEPKEYGTKRVIEGAFLKGEKCLIIEDVVTTGSSVLETRADLLREGLEVSDAIVLLDREQGGQEALAAKGVKMHALLTLTQLMNYLRDGKCISDDLHGDVLVYLSKMQVNVKCQPDRTTLTFEERIPYAKNEMAANLMKVIVKKKSNLCVSADLTDANEILALAESVGPFVCCVKTHIDTVENFNEQFVASLKEIAGKHNFLVLEDRKFSDIGQTVKMQYTKGAFRISSWADYITVHSLSGTGVIDAVLPECVSENAGVFLLAEYSGRGSLIDPKYVKATIIMGQLYSQIVAGFVCQSKLFLDEPGFLQLTPGVHMVVSGDSLDQQYTSPTAAILEKGADIGVVGRGITKAANPEKAAKEYRDILWSAYDYRVTK